MVVNIATSTTANDWPYEGRAFGGGKVLDAMILGDKGDLMVDPSSVLDSQRRKVADAEFRVAAAQAELVAERNILQGMEALEAAFRAAAKNGSGSILRVGSSEPATHRKIGGRQPGSITKEWRLVLAKLGTEPFTAADLAAYPQVLFGRSVSVAEGRRRLDLFLHHDYVEQVGEGRFRVTQHAITKFGLDRLNANASVSTEADDRDEGAATPSHPQLNPQPDKEGGGSA